MPLIITTPFFVPPVSGWDLANASYDGVSFSVNSQTSQPRGIVFKDDGTKMYVVGIFTNTVFQYTLSTPWVVSSATYDSIFFDVSSEEGDPSGLSFKSDGTKMYVVGQGSNIVSQYTLSTPWVISSATYDSVSFGVGSQGSNTQEVTFKPDGTRMYVVGQTNDTVFQYTLSTPWVVSSATYNSISFSIGGQETRPTGLFFKPDGTKMYVIGFTSDRVHQYTLSTPWVVSSATYDNTSIYIGTQDSNPQAVTFKSDGTKMYMVGETMDTVYQYSL